MNKITLCSAFLGLASAPFFAQAFDELTPHDAYEAVLDQDGTYIVDVRTDAEWQWVGHPGVNTLGDGAGLVGKVVNVSWMIVKGKNWIVNPSFIRDMNEIFPDKDDVSLIMMCRSGGRSAAAAAALEADGYHVSNMEHGFEGSTDQFGYRTKNGWKVDGLPYTASASGQYPD